MDELKKRKRILRRLGYCNADEVILTKGRIACEISAADELGTLLAGLSFAYLCLAFAFPLLYIG